MEDKLFTSDLGELMRKFVWKLVCKVRGIFGEMN